MSYKFNPFTKKPDYYETSSAGSVDEVARDNIVVLAWKLAIAEGLSVFNLEDGVVDEFEDETGVDTTASTNESYNSTDDYYSPSEGVVVDNMEYSSDANAQAAYVTNGTYGSDLCTGGTASASSEYSATYSADKACDDNPTTYWGSSNNLGYDQTWQYDLGDGNAKIISKLTIQNVADYGINAFVFSGSNNGSSWTELYSGNASNNEDVQEFAFSNQTAYRYYKIYETSGYSESFCCIREIQFLPISLQCYSESTIKTQGSYSLKGIATTGALNDTLTRDLASVVDLSGVSWITIDLRSDRASANITFGIQQSVSVSASLTPTLVSAGSFERFTWSLDAISNGAKNKISALYITLVNADASNTFYVDRWASPIGNMTLISESSEAEDEPTEGRFLALVEPVDSITVNTDLLAYISNDDGSNYDQVTLEDEGYFDSTKKILSGNVTLTDRSDKTMVQKIATANNKDLKVHAWGMLWK